MRVGIDIGGTFTDFVLYDGEIKTFKLRSTPEAPERAVLDGLARIGLGKITEVIHGSTVATNAVLERRGARTALVASEGFRDLLTIGRQNRSELYDLFADRPESLVPRERCFEVAERVTHQGEVLVELDEAQLMGLVDRLKDQGTETVAICFLFSFLRPDHESSAAEVLEGAGLQVTTSSQLLPEFREYERASTAAINAYVMPMFARYIGQLQAGIGSIPLRIMQSNGGSLSARQTQLQPARAILSGPAAGVVGALRAGESAGLSNVIAFDMGGTSTDVSLTTGEIQLTSEGEIDGLPLRLPMIDIHTVGSGGGSLARVDAGGSLRVGPQSAGAEPGPACYGRGGTGATVTDANLVLGRLDPDRFLGGEMRLDLGAASTVLDQLGADLGVSAGLERAPEAALGVIQVTNAYMARALRLVSVARGHDPRDFTLVSFGGAGGLHACDVARAVGVRRVLIPPNAATLSALGMLAADVSRDYVQTVMLPGSSPDEQIGDRLSALQGQGLDDLEAEGFTHSQIETSLELDLRYRGQSYELTVPFSAKFVEDFHTEHSRQYGYSDQDLPIEIVNLRVRALGRVEPLAMPENPPATQDAHVARIGDRRVVFGTETRPIPYFDGRRLQRGHQISGPALIAFPDTTVLLKSDDRADVDSVRNLVIQVAPL